MSRRYRLRSDSEVQQSLQASEDTVLALDEPSDEDYEDNEEVQSGSESEEEGEEEFQPQNDLESHEELEEEIVNEESQPSSRKRARTTTRGSDDPSQCGEKRDAIPGKNGYRWYVTPRDKSQRRQNPSSSCMPTPIGKAKDVRTALEAWNLLLKPLMLRDIQIHTNEEIHRFRESMQSENVLDATYSDVELLELAAFFGLMYFSGLQKASKTNLEDLWSNEFGSTLYRATMSLRRFKFLSRMLRFDDKTTRTERRAADKFAPIREIWEEFVSNCTTNYNPASACTVDEQILAFHGRCPFKIYKASKQDKYGVKIVMLNDSRTHYMLTAEPYVRKVNIQDGENLPSYYIRKVSQPIHGTSRNVTCDNWFSSVEVFDKMLRDHSITMVGTLRKNKSQIPDSFRVAGKVGSAKYAFDDTKTLMSYTPEKNKVVILLSTLHHTADIDPQTKKPEMIDFYNTTKEGTGTFDHMCHEYTTARKTLRWTTRVWMGMLDQAGINAMILYNFNSANVLLNRRDFLKALIMGLVEPHLYARLNYPRLRRDLRLSIQLILKIDMDTKVPKQPVGDKTRSRCSFCPRSQDRKVRVFCNTCRRAVCEDHKTISCLLCSTQV